MRRRGRGCCGYASALTLPTRARVIDPAPTSPAITVMAVDDHALMRSGIASVIDAEPDMRLVAEASTGLEAVAQGEPKVIEDFTAWAHQGPPDARVDDVKSSEAGADNQGPYAGFHVRADA